MTLTSVEAREGRVLRERLGYGLCELDDVERWADRLIERMEEPPYGLIQLGLARVNGVDACFEAFEALAAGTSTADDILLALASAEVDRMDVMRLYGMLSSISHRATIFDAFEGLGENRSVKALYRAYGPYDDFFFLQEGEISEEQWRKAVRQYVREIREVAAELETVA